LGTEFSFFLGWVNIYWWRSTLWSILSTTCLYWGLYNR